MTIQRCALVLLLLAMSSGIHAMDSYSTVSAAYRCDSKGGMTLIATKDDFSARRSKPDKDGYLHAWLGSQTFRCKGGTSAVVVVQPPQPKGACGGAGRVVVTDITFPGGQKHHVLYEFNKECVYSDYITRMKITRSGSHYSVESCSERNRFNKEAFIGCTTTTPEALPEQPQP
ncbi:hypothetical protein [Stenotrophomonas sp.]|uniref:hypothetical protein n=1 Tax=Stenotrophomonas sp. TaxID=69392 RepID=UPI00289D5DED|nr:hypothetical protein [Stenotrophomonas sp.]